MFHSVHFKKETCQRIIRKVLQSQSRSSVVVLATALDDCNTSVSSWLECYYVSVLSHALLAATGSVGRVSVVIRHHHWCSNTVRQWDALREGPEHRGPVLHAARWVSVEVSVVAVHYPVGVTGCQTVVLENEVSIIVFIVTVTLCDAVALVTRGDIKINSSSNWSGLILILLFWRHSMMTKYSFVHGIMSRKQQAL